MARQGLCQHGLTPNSNMNVWSGLFAPMTRRTGTPFMLNTDKKGTTRTLHTLSLAFLSYRFCILHVSSIERYRDSYLHIAVLRFQVYLDNDMTLEQHPPSPALHVTGHNTETICRVCVRGGELLTQLLSY